MKRYGAAEQTFQSSFSPTELYTLTEAVVAGVDRVHAGARQLERSVKHLGSPKDTRRLRDEAHETQQSVSASIAATTRDIKRLTAIVRRGDKYQKLQVDKLTQNFSDSVNEYSAILKQYLEKMQAHIPKTPMTDFASEEGTYVNDDDQARLVAQQQAQAQMLEFDNGLLEEREGYVRKIETVVLDVNQMMQELSVIIHSQGEVIDTIEGSIEAANSRVETGTEHLVKASSYQNKFRRKMFIIFLIALVCGIIITIIIVTSTKR